MPYKYIGKTTDFCGKPLWEILGNLKNFGVGRVLTRSRFDRYPEPTYIKVLKVEALPNPKNPGHDNIRKVKVTVEKVFRGKKMPELITLESSTYKPDYRLLPREEEAIYCREIVDTKQTVLPKYMEFPPLMGELIKREIVASGETVKCEPTLEVVYNKDRCWNMKYRLAKDGEKVDKEIVFGVGTPASPGLYKGLQV